MSELIYALKNISEPKYTFSDIVDRLSNLPNNIKVLESQIAGHKLGIFIDTQTNYILKPVIDKRGVCEQTFYQNVFDKSNANDKKILRLRSFVPSFIKVEILNEIIFFSINNITKDMNNPSLMDIKIGVISYDRNASEEKIIRENKKNILSKYHGFRILGIKRWSKKINNYITKDRTYCRSISPKNVEELLMFYLEQDEKENFKKLVTFFLEKSNDIKLWFEEDNIDFLEFIGSSILLVYSFEDNILKTNLKMIDFAHVFPIEGSIINLNDKTIDLNYLVGLDSLINIFEELLII